MLETTRQCLDYQPPHLISRLKEKLTLSDEDTEQLSIDLFRFLDLAGTYDSPLVPSPAIDAAWHEFILMTREYVVFCERFFGTFLDHSLSCSTQSISTEAIIKTIELAQNERADHKWESEGKLLLE